MPQSPDRVISIALSNDVWRAFTDLQPEPVSWLRSRILESIEQARSSATGAADTRKRA